MKRISLSLALVLVLNVFAFAQGDLVKNGKATSEIIVAPDALPQVRFAAKELQDHLEKISGAIVPILEVPSGNVYPIYVGESEGTAKLGITTDGLKMEGYKVVATDKALALIGKDARFNQQPAGFNSADDVPRLTKEWQEYVGKDWKLPRNNVYDPRNYRKDLDFSLYDPTGTLFAVYDFLEGLGVRWYYPDTETGTVIPEQKTVSIEGTDRSKHPVFARRFMRWSFPTADLEGFLWFKRQKLGMSEMVWFCHGTGIVTGEKEEFKAIINGLVDKRKKGRTETYMPRLAEPLEVEMADFADKFFKRYPDFKTWSAAPADGFVAIDDRDKAAGWQRPERGPSGELTDYVWTFVNNVAKRVREQHPDKVVMGLAYGRARQVPADVKELSPNLGIVYCQTRTIDMVDPKRRKEMVEEREKWRSMMGNDEFYIWEYYLGHGEKHRLPGVPIVFTKLMQEDTKRLVGKSKGEYVECSYGVKQMANPGLNHYPYQIQAQLYWNPNLDIDAYLTEYTTKFYGPAAAEMKEFFQFAEETWMRPGSRNMGDANYFLTADAVTKMLDLLAKAKEKAGSGIYGKRVAVVAEEAEPMRHIFTARSDYESGVSALEAKRFDEAASYFKAAAETASDETSRMEALNKLGDVYQKELKNNALAIEAFLAVEAIHPKSLSSNRRSKRMEGYIKGVNLLTEEGRYDEATTLLDRNSNAEHGYWAFQNKVARGNIEAAKGNKEAAIAIYMEAVEIKQVQEGLIAALLRKVEKLQKR